MPFYGFQMGNNPLGKEGAGAQLLLEAIQRNQSSAVDLLDVMVIT